MISEVEIGSNVAHLSRHGYRDLWYICYEFTSHIQRVVSHVFFSNAPTFVDVILKERRLSKHGCFRFSTESMGAVLGMAKEALRAQNNATYGVVRR